MFTTNGEQMNQPIANDLTSLRTFVREEIAPRASTWDEQESMPREHVRRLANAGLLAQTIANGALVKTATNAPAPVVTAAASISAFGTPTYYTS